MAYLLPTFMLTLQSGFYSLIAFLRRLKGKQGIKFKAGAVIYFDQRLGAGCSKHWSAPKKEK